MPCELQALVDELAEKLSAPAVLEDREHRLLVHSVHSDDIVKIDDLRRDSILRRQAEPDALLLSRKHGITGISIATGPVRVPAADGVLGRLCVPVRHRGRLVGFLWFIDDAADIDDAAIAGVGPTLRELALLMHEADVPMAGRALARLLSPSEEVREATAQQIVEEDTAVGRAPFVVLVARAMGCPRRQVRDIVRQALRDITREPGGPFVEPLRLARGDHGVLLVRVPSPGDDTPALATAERLRAALLHRLHEYLTAAGAAGTGGSTGTGEPGRIGAAGDVGGVGGVGGQRGVGARAGLVRAIVGIGEPQRRLARATVSYRQARLAARVAALVPSVGDITRWHNLGAFRVLAQLPSAEAAEQAMDPRVVMLFDTTGPEVVATLETYLDLGCDAKATSERLYLHRTTLYYRLDKIERLTGVDLHNGDDRLAVHLSLKLARLAGMYPS